MSVSYDAERGLFRLDTEEITYAFCALPDGRLCHLYFGGRLRQNTDLDDLLTAAKESHTAGGVSADRAFLQEYAVQEAFDYGQDALFPVWRNGSRGVRLRYAGHAIGKEEIRVRLRDERETLEAELIYRVYDGQRLIGRRAVIRALREEKITLERAFSATVHLPAELRRLTHLSGAWGMEYTRQRQTICQGAAVLENHRGTCAAHQHVPFLALDDGGAAEEAGEVYFFLLCWSGDMKMTAEKDHLGRVRLTAGVSDWDFAWPLDRAHPFTAPEVLLGYTAKGFSGMSRQLYDWAYDFACPQSKILQPRPVIYNSWYPYEFLVDGEKCAAMARRAAAVGAELFVVDDGWMPGRVNERTGLGDWTPDPARFPHGFQPVIDACRACGIGFGLWVEPEMVNPDSDLFRAHPDWIIGEEQGADDLMRSQYVLDFSRDEVRDWCMAWLDDLLTRYRLDYLKWDMNRYLSRRGNDRALPVKYIENLYAVWRFLQEKYPHVLFENCASGGGRADFGMLPFSDRVNRSDNADPVDVLRIHEGFTALFPPKLAGGAGNISPSPNGINGRAAPFAFRAAVGMNGSMSIGVNLLTCTEEEEAEIRKAVARFKRFRADLQDSYVLRIKSVYDGPVSALEYLRRDGGAVSLLVYGHGLRYLEGRINLRLRDLEAAASYRDENGNILSGAALMHRGIPVHLQGDYAHAFFYFVKEEDPCLD